MIVKKNCKFIIVLLIICSPIVMAQTVLDKKVESLLLGGKFNDVKRILNDSAEVAEEPAGSVEMNWFTYYGWEGNPEKDQFLARPYLEKAYQAGRLDAHALLMMGYFVGNMAQLIDFNRGEKLAKEFLVRCFEIIANDAAETGACYGTFGQMLIYGMGVPKNEKKGLEFLRRGERLGHQTSSNMLDYFLGKDRRRENPTK